MLALLLVVFVASGLVLRGYWHEQANHELILAIKANDADRALDALKAQADLNSKDASGRTALDFNVWSGDDNAADVLLENGAYHPSALRDAVRFQHIEPLGRMLRLGWRCDTPNEKGQTPLMGAASNRHPILVQILLQHGAQVDMRTKSGETAMALAHDNSTPFTSTDRLEVVRLLKKAGEKE